MASLSSPFNPTAQNARRSPLGNFFQTRRPTRQEIDGWFGAGAGASKGLAILCGQVSGGLEVLDIDSWEYVTPWKLAVRKLAPGLLKRLVMVQTPRPGLHVFYRCGKIHGNQKLASIPVKEKKTGKRKPKVIIETRGEGGYVLAPPSPAACHPTGRPYELIRGELSKIPTITTKERKILLNAAKSLNRWQEPEPKAPPKHATTQAAANRDRPGDDFNARATWREILEPHGWRFLYADGGCEHWRRPGKRGGGASATVNHGDSDLLYVFSSNADPFEPGRGYTKFTAFVRLEFDGDYRAASKALARKGYGKQRRRMPRFSRLALGASRRSFKIRNKRLGKFRPFGFRH